MVSRVDSDRNVSVPAGDTDFADWVLPVMRHEFGAYVGKVVAESVQEGPLTMANLDSDAFVFFGATGNLAYK